MERGDGVGSLGDFLAQLAGRLHFDAGTKAQDPADQPVGQRVFQRHLEVAIPTDLDARRIEAGADLVREGLVEPQLDVWVCGFGLKELIAAELLEVEVGSDREGGLITMNDHTGQALDLEQTWFVVAMTASDEIPGASVVEQRIGIDATLLGQAA